jgi:hypothetical protein
MSTEAPVWPPPGSLNVLPLQAEAPRRRPWLPIAAVGAVLSVLAVVAFVLLGGPSGPSAADAATIVRATSHRAASVGSSNVSIDMTMSVEGHSIHATGTGGFDYRRRTGSFSLTMPEVGQMQEVVTPRALYMRLPDRLLGALGTDRPWMKVRFSAMKAAGVDMSKLMNANPGGDPTAMLRMLSNVQAVQQDGTEDVRGVHTTRYAVSATMLDMMRAEGLTGAIDSMKLPPGFADSRINMVVSVDKSGLPRRMRMSMDLAGMGSMTMTMELFDFGAPIDVTIPPPSIVTDISR